MNNYCVVFHITEYSSIGKIKIDYGFFPVEKTSSIENSFGFKSLVAKDTDVMMFDKTLTRFWKKKEEVYFQKIIETESEDMLEIERNFLPKIEKEICRKIPFRFAYKKALKARIERIFIDQNL